MKILFTHALIAVENGIKSAKSNPITSPSIFTIAYVNFACDSERERKLMYKMRVRIRTPE